MSSLPRFHRLRNDLGRRAARRPRRAARRACRPCDVRPLEERRLLSTTFTVISTADDGRDGTLRWAINQVNADPAPDADTIGFAIAGTGPFTIEPTSALPAITHPVLVDGTSQAGFAPGAPVVELDGALVGTYDPGLTLSAGGSTIQGLVINRFLGAGLALNNVNNDVIQSNFIGTDTTGTVAEANGLGGVQFSYYSSNANVTIGGTTAAARNVISGNTGVGVLVPYSYSNGIEIQGNFIGTDATGTKPLGNSGDGIQTDNYVFSGHDEFTGNVISANGGDGIDDQSYSYSSAQDVIQGNVIGTDVTGTKALGNGISGIFGNYGTPLLVSGNVISANAYTGITLYSYGSTVQSNKIGTDVTGTQPMGNHYSGLDLETSNILVGGTTAANANVIADNGGAGVLVDFGSGDGILGNSIFGNTGLGIALNYGGNHQQDAPVVTHAIDFGSVTAITGTLKSGPSTTFTIQLFSNPTPDPSGYGQGRTYLGSTTVTSDSTGTAGFQVNLPVAVPAGQVITATATDPYDNTSEFSNDSAVVAAKPPVAAIDDAYNTDVKTALSVAAPGVLGNDISIDNGAFTAALVKNVAHGTVVLNPDGSFTYTPKGGYTGPDSFTYVDVEGTSTSAPATVAISVNSKTQVVTNTADGGPGSLRQALTIAATSNTTDPDTIRFAIPGTGPFVIQPATPLPAVTHATVIDGDSQPGAKPNTLAVGDNAVILIRLDGSLLVNGIDGLNIAAANSQVEGLSITNFSVGIDLVGPGGDQVQGNFVGLTPGGQAGFIPSGSAAVNVATAAGNRIGGTSPADRNVIDAAGYYNADVFVTGPNNLIQGNEIGTDLTGTQALGDVPGLHLSGAANTTIGGTAEGAGNVIFTQYGTSLLILDNYGGPASTGTLIQGNFIGVNAAGTLGSSGPGLVISSGTGTVVGGTKGGAGNVVNHVSVSFGVSGVSIQGNLIGTDATGTKPLALYGDGIDLGGATQVTIGGTARGAGNVISGSLGYGIYDLSYSSTPTGNVIQGNKIGTDVTGTLALPNGYGGVFVASNGDLIGGTTDRAANVISGNGGFGVEIYGSFGSNVRNVLVQGNLIGTDVTGAKPLGNAGDGVTIWYGVSNSTIGGTAAGAGNVIAYNGGNGVGLNSYPYDPNVNDAILSNAIYGNAKLGIDLGNDGVTPNTPGGPHSGPNDLQNYPVLLVGATHGAQTAIKGTLSAAPGTSFLVQFFSNPSADPSGHGQGQTYLGSITVVTDATGNALFQGQFKSQPGTVVTATATDPNGNTSEFSADVALVASQTSLLAQNDAYRIDTNDVLTVAAPGVQSNDIAFSTKPVVSSVVVGPAHGKLTLAADGSFVYTPTPGYIGPDSFTYKDNLAGQSAFASVAITVAPKTFVVTNTNDSGPGSLRQAIQNADLATSPSPDTILFAIPGTGPFAIQPATPQPAVTHPTVIDGYSQAGSKANTLAQGDNAVILIRIDGSGLSGYPDGLLISGGSSTVDGLAISGFGNNIHLTGAGGDVIRGDFIGTDATGLVAGPGNLTGLFDENSVNLTVGGSDPSARNVISGNGACGILLVGTAGVPFGATIQGNYVGVDATGLAGLGNAFQGIGVFDAGGCTIGGTAAGQGNVISANSNCGIAIGAAGSTGDVIQGNLIGTDATGTKGLGNAFQGVYVGYWYLDSTHNGSAADATIGGTATGAGNLISGNGINGIQISGYGANFNVVQGNKIGTDVSGTFAIGNHWDGVNLTNGAAYNTVGGITSGSGNLLSGNLSGASIYSYTSSNTIEGNLIGTDVTGMKAIANVYFGVYDSGSDNTIGGIAAGAGNVISGNGFDGIYVEYASGVAIEGNFIGTDITGASALGNHREGVYLLNYASNNTVGGTAAGAGNVIAFNAANGVAVGSSPYSYSVTGNAILSNAIFSNGGLGIDLGNDGVTLNAPGYNYGLPNNLQSYPVLASAVTVAGGTTIAGTLDSTPYMTFTIQFFSDPTADPSGHGQGETFLGSLVVTADASGHVDFSWTAPVAVPAGQVVSATATDLYGDTSEFSADLVVTSGAAVVQPTPSAATVDAAIQAIAPATPARPSVALPAVATPVSSAPQGPLAITGLVTQAGPRRIRPAGSLIGDGGGSTH